MSVVHNGYGKSGIRLVKVVRRGDLHDVQDLDVDVRFEGEFGRAYTDGDNTMVLPTDTMKNTVYALAREIAIEDVEPFGLGLTEHFLGSTPDVRQVRVDLAQRPWDRLVVGGKTQGRAFVRPSGERRTASVTRTRAEVTVEAGIRDLLVLKTSGSGFEDFLVDGYTTLKETSDRLLATVVNASWTYTTSDVEFGLRWRGIRQAMLDAFAEHVSRSVQHTLHLMGRAALDICDDIAEIRLSLPNKHHLLVDLSAFGLDNPNEIFVATEAPYGLIEATIRR
jgi:urate oxidase